MKVGLFDPQEDIRRKQDVAAFKSRLDSKEPFPVLDPLKFQNDPTWMNFMSQADQIPLGQLASSYFVYNNIYNLQVFDGPVRVRFPESLFDGTSIGEGVDIPLVSSVLRSLQEKTPDVTALKAVSSLAYPSSSWDGSSLGGSGSLVPTVLSFPTAGSTSSSI